MKENKGSNSKLSIKEGKDADYPVMADNTTNSLNIIDFIITSLSNNEEENCKNAIHDERSKEYNESKKEKEKKVSFDEEPLEKQHQQPEINGESGNNIITSNVCILDNIDHIEKDHNYHRLKQGMPRSKKSRSIIDIYKNTKRLSPPEEEYRHTSTLESHKTKVHNEGETKKDQVNISEEIVPNKIKQNIIQGEFENIGDNRSNLSPKENKDEEDHLNKGISERIVFQSLVNLCEVIVQKEITEERDESETRKDQEDSIDKELPDQQQQDIIVQKEITGEHDESETRKDQEDSIDKELPDQQKQNIIGEPELNKVTSEDNHFSNDNEVNCGSKLLTRDENNGNYRITQGLPRSTKFRSISNLYKCTTRMSLVEDEYNWNLSRGKDSLEDSNMYCSKKEDSSGKKDFGGKRKCRENQKGDEEKDAMT
ncbi:uncharacterized protein LOC114075607 [Solanum pennellii]|uniref:Uncharacterized protein LOC114075607 n=1 Tax=Solanum pennellii TaxID=28526 RepID=A0ABM1V273_SOLPN|nr:uncharacterized protein LOC114075607 [Solanum pennellii]